MGLFGSTSSYSSTDTTNVTTTSTSTVANAFNNALNTTQNFSNIGGVPANPGQSFGGGIDPSMIIMLAIAGIGAFILFRK